MRQFIALIWYSKL